LEIGGRALLSLAQDNCEKLSKFSFGMAYNYHSLIMCTKEITRYSLVKKECTSK